MLPAQPGARPLARRGTRVALYALLATSPYVPGLVLPGCAAHCDDAGRGCGGCVTTFSFGRLLLDLLFTCVLLREGPQLAHTLHDVYHASHLNKADVQAFARSTCRTFLAVFSLLWVLLPVLDVIASLRGVGAGYSVSRGDLATRVLWVLAGPARAVLMTACMSAVVLVMRLHSLDLKAVRAAARLAAADVRRGPSAAVAYFGALLSALAVNTRLLNTSSVRLQRLVAFLLVFGINAIFAIGLFYFSNAAALNSVDASSTQQQFEVLEQFLHESGFVLCALVALASAAHLTALCDSTARALSAGLAAHLAASMAALPDAAAPLEAATGSGGVAHARIEPEVAQEAALLVELIANAAESGGFRILGQRVTFGWFAFMLTVALGMANFGLSTVKASGSGADKGAA